MTDTLIFNAAILFLAASLHEDVAILMAAMFAVERGVPPVYGLTAVYAGTVANNYAVYGFGVAARQLPGLRRWLISGRADAVRRRLKRHFVPTIVLCRFVPGSLSPTLLGCGWLGVPFTHFASIIAISAALYVLLIATLVFTFGESLIRQFGEHAWLVALAMTIFAVVALRANRYWRTAK